MLSDTWLSAQRIAAGVAAVAVSCGGEARTLLMFVVLGDDFD